MPRDELDGIRTFKGRVVYDRPKHPFTQKDVNRIMKKVITEIDDDSGAIDSCAHYTSLAEVVMQRLMDIAAQILSRDCPEGLSTIIDGLYVIIDYLHDKDVIPDSAFGGAGATRDF